MSMTRKDFILIAKSLEKAKGFACYEKSFHALICEEMSRSLRETNPRFDRIIFLRACGLTMEDIESL